MRNRRGDKTYIHLYYNKAPKGLWWHALFSASQYNETEAFLGGHSLATLTEEEAGGWTSPLSVRKTEFPIRALLCDSFTCGTTHTNPPQTYFKET